MPVGINNEPPVPVVTDKGPDVQNNTEPSKSGKALVGIIYPPLEIRNIVDKTASFVARNGPEFEVRIRQHEANNPRFNFLTPTDPYHTYYQHKVKEFIEGKAVEPSAAPPKSSGPVLPQKVQDAIKAAEFVPKDPPREFEFTADPATINAFDLDLIKLTASFVARNGRQFLTQLMTREARNYQFDFLKPQHSNFGYFTKLVEQYTKILIPSKDLNEKLRKELNEPRSILDAVKYRVEWERHQRRLREKEEAAVEKERLAYAQIDWHDFVVVQTVDFQPHETVNLPPPCTPKDVGARILAQQRLEATKTSAQTMEMEVESEGEESDREEEGGQGEPSQSSSTKTKTGSTIPAKDATEDSNLGSSVDKLASDKSAAAAAPATAPPLPASSSTSSSVQQPAPAPPNPENVVIRTDYNPRSKQLEKVKQSDQQKWIISPLTGEKILADKLAEHMRYNTVDSQYFVQKERELQDRQEDEPVFAAGVDISANIVSFAERRSDIFGVGSRGAEQAMIGKKLGEEERPRVDPKTIWDGHAASVDSATRAAQSHVSIEDQIAQIHRAQGLLPNQDKERIGPKSGAGGGADFHHQQQQHQQHHHQQQQQQQQQHQQQQQNMASKEIISSTSSAAAAASGPSSAAIPQNIPTQIVQSSTAPNIGGMMNQGPQAFSVRPAMTATVVPVVQVTPTPVLLVQQPTIGVVSGFMSQRPQFPPFGGVMPPRMSFGAGPPQGQPPFFGAGGPPHMMPGPPPQPQLPVAPPRVVQPPQVPQPVDEEPAAKRQKTSEDQLVNEMEWMNKYGGKGPVNITVQCPNVTDKPEWRLNGQTLTISMDLREIISSLKTKIQEATNLPAGKQKLLHEGLFVKDSQSLAYYNVMNGSVVQLQLKERGGRKK